MADYVLDTSAILASLFAEEGFLTVQRILRDAEANDRVRIYVPFMALMEVEYQLMRLMSIREVEQWLNVVLNWPIEVVESSNEWRHVAAAVKSEGRISLGDSWVAALALLRDVELLHKDPEFDAVVGLKALRLPYDGPRRSRS